MLNSVKLINALTCIINGDIGGIYFPCNSGYECPYYVDDGDGLWECRRQDCLADVVILLKEQEKQLKEWEKHVPFLAAHGILKGDEDNA